MFEDMSFENILDRMLERVPDTLDKREGSVIYDALAPAATELFNVYMALDMVLDETFADTATREYLIKRAEERGIIPYPATYAVVRGVFTPASVEIPVGSRFSLGEQYYHVTEKVADGIYRLRCEILGSEGGRDTGTLIPVEYIDGLETAQITEVLSPGDDEEDTEHLRARYFASMDTLAFGGNVADYKEKLGAMANVVGVKVSPCHDLPEGEEKIIRITVIGTGYRPLHAERIEQIQQEVDPYGDRQGDGQAPIGHVVRVKSVEDFPIEIQTSITFQNGWQPGDNTTALEEAASSYFADLAKTWADEESLVVRISQLDSRLLSVAGVQDISATTLNGENRNLVLDSDHIPALGALEAAEAVQYGT